MRRRIAVSDGLQAKWHQLKAALSAAAAPLTGKPEFPISPFYAHDLTGGEKEIAAALRGLGDGAQASFAVGQNGLLQIEILTWT